MLSYMMLLGSSPTALHVSLPLSPSTPVECNSAMNGCPFPLPSPTCGMQQYNGPYKLGGLPITVPNSAHDGDFEHLTVRWVSRSGSGCKCVT